MKTLVDLNACTEAQRWFNEQPNAYRAYLACERPDWLFWLAGKLNLDHRLIVLAACDIARTVLPHVPKGEDRPRIAIETAEAWCKGEATIAQVRFTANAAYAAYVYSAYAANYAAYAAYAANYAAADAAASYAAAYASSAAYAAYAAYAAECADTDAARKKAQKEHCKIIRRHITWKMVKEAAQ